VSTTQTMEVTLYGWADNDPPGAGIAYPVIHQQAGGIGTYSDPITFATDPREIPVGTEIYIPYLEKYFVMEDYCAQSVIDWQNGMWHVDLWTQSDASTNTTLLYGTEDYYTKSAATVIIDPASNLPVDTTPLLNNPPIYPDTPTAPTTNPPPQTADVVVALDDAANVKPGHVTTGHVLTNDTDSAGLALSVTGIDAGGVNRGKWTACTARPSGRDADRHHLQ
jgi:3D (Asp-Asp-Asp) domain-containing protein